MADDIVVADLPRGIKGESCIHTRLLERAPRNKHVSIPELELSVLRYCADTLIANGFRSSREFLDVGQIQLAKELSCSIDEASSIKRQVELACRVAARIETRPSSLAGGTYESAIQTPGMGQSVSSESETSALSILEHKAMSPCKGVITFC